MEHNRFVEIPLGLTGKLYRSPMPFASFDQDHTLLNEYQSAGVTQVVMLTEPGEDLIRAGRDLTRLYSQHQIKTIHYPIKDFGSPEDLDELRTRISDVLALVSTGEKVAIHCYAGRGRTGLFIAILAKAALGLKGEEAIRWVRQYFPAIETKEQEDLVREY